MPVPRPSSVRRRRPGRPSLSTNGPPPRALPVKRPPPSPSTSDNESDSAESESVMGVPDPCEGLEQMDGGLPPAKRPRILRRSTSTRSVSMRGDRAVKRPPPSPSTSDNESGSTDPERVMGVPDPCEGLEQVDGGLPPAKRPRILRRSTSSRSRSNQFVPIALKSTASTAAVMPSTRTAVLGSDSTSDPATISFAVTETTTTTTAKPKPVQETVVIEEAEVSDDGHGHPASVPASSRCARDTCTPPSSSPLSSSGPADFVVASQFRFQNFFTTPIPLRHSPLPSLHWADSRELWTVMLRKEERYTRDANLLDRHTTLQARMRSILLDWLIEVCEVYRLHRETFYLAVDFIDRYLSQTTNIHKQQLQLIGITALFVAAKLEEIYPPRLAEFAYVTDGACTVTEILEQELVILKQLKWDLSPLTVNAWLNVYMQLVNLDAMEEKEQNFIIPQYSQHAFIQIARLLDLCFLDIGCLQYSYSVLATSAVYHITSEAVALAVSGYKWIDIAACVQWMAPFATTLREVGQTELKFFSQVTTEDAHNVQTHAVDLTLLERSQARQTQVETSSRASPDYSREIAGIITPPQSKGKQRACD